MVINLNFTLSSVDADRLLRYKEKDKCEHLSTNDYAKKLLEDELFKKCFLLRVLFLIVNYVIIKIKRRDYYVRRFN